MRRAASESFPLIETVIHSPILPVTVRRVITAREIYTHQLFWAA